MQTCLIPRHPASIVPRNTAEGRMPFAVDADWLFVPIEIDLSGVRRGKYEVAFVCFFVSGIWVSFCVLVPNFRQAARSNLMIQSKHFHLSSCRSAHFPVPVHSCRLKQGQCLEQCYVCSKYPTSINYYYCYGICSHLKNEGAQYVLTWRETLRGKSSNGVSFLKERNISKYFSWKKNIYNDNKMCPQRVYKKLTTGYFARKDLGV